MLDFLIIFAILAAVVFVVGGPVRAAAGARTSKRRGPSSRVADLEAARDAKYREIRDADLDHRTGKLSDADYQAVDQSLRAEAVEILRALDRAAENGNSALP